MGSRLRGNDEGVGRGRVGRHAPAPFVSVVVFDQHYRGVEAEAVDAAFVGFGDFELPAARMIDALADLRDMACEQGGEATQRVDIAIDLGEPRVDQFGGIL